MNEIFRQQIQKAFAARPGLDGTIHGLRKIKQGKQGSRSSLFYSAKNRCLIPVESRLERAYCYVLEVDRNVREYRTQFLRLRYLGDDIYPDFQICTVDGEYVVAEVKPEAYQQTEQQELRTHFLREILGREEISYMLVGEAQCCGRDDFETLVMLYSRGGRSGFARPLLAQVSEIVASEPNGSISVELLRAKLKELRLSERLVEAALFSGLLVAADRKSFSHLTPLEVMP
jgi:hypothetical protein